MKSNQYSNSVQSIAMNISHIHIIAIFAGKLVHVVDCFNP